MILTFDTTSTGEGYLKIKSSGKSITIFVGRKLHIILGVLVASLLLLSGSCGKEKPCQDLPDLYVDIFIQPNTLDFIADGGWAYVTANSPSRGIIVYRPFHDEFIAYERICPYDPYGCCEQGDPNSCARLYVEENGIIIVDSCCMSRYLMTDGTPFEGPSNCLLYQYQTLYDGTYLRIFN